MSLNWKNFLRFGGGKKVVRHYVTSLFLVFYFYY